MKAEKVTDTTKISAKIPSPARTRHLILWDGDCGFCQQSVAWLMARDKRGQFEAMPYQSAPAPPMTPALAAACQKAVHVLTRDGRTLKAGRAGLFLLEHIGFGVFARILTHSPFIWFVELGYRLVAHNRYFFSRLLFGKDVPACRLPEK